MKRVLIAAVCGVLFIGTSAFAGDNAQKGDAGQKGGSAQKGPSEIKNQIHMGRSKVGRTPNR